MLPLLAALALSPAAGAADLGWSTTKVNASLRRMPDGGSPVVVRVFVADSAKSSADRLALQLFMANHLFRGLDPASPSEAPAQPLEGAGDCGVRFEFQKAESFAWPDAYRDLAAPQDRSDKSGEAFYGGSDRLSAAENELFGKIRGAASGEINVVYLPGLGGGRGYSYLPHFLRGALEKTAPKGADLEKLVAEGKNTILLSDTASFQTLAHELGHVLTNSGHVRPCSEEDRASDPEGCAEADKNLLLPDGRYGQILDEGQCRKVRRLLKKGHLDR